MIIRVFPFVYFIFSFIQSADAQNYAVSNIPDSIRKNANAVVRYHSGVYTVQDIDLANYTEKMVVTIFNKNGQHLSYRSIRYDKYSKIKNIEGLIYDAQGNIIRKIKKDDIDDVSDFTSFSLFEDSRYKTVDLRQKMVPYTISITYSKEIYNLYYAPDWHVHPGEGVTVEKSTFQIIAPDGLMPRTKIRNSNKQPRTTEILSNEQKAISHQFVFNNVKSIKREPYGKSLVEMTPSIIVAPAVFKFDSYMGDFSDWDSYAIWQSEINKGRDQISERTKHEIDSLVAGIPDDESKTKAIYEYMQNKTRYVSIQLGIGGLQTFPAETVEETGYGDCKALSNYTISLLKYANIESHYALVYGGSNPPPIVEEFPYHAFNHVIVCVPNQGDTLWLECTSQQNPFAYIGRFTGDRDVLLITENGGKIVHTTTYQQEDNLQIRAAEVVLDLEGNGTAKINTQYTGLQYENFDLDHYVYEDISTQKEWTLQHTEIPNFQMDKFSYSINKDKIPSVNQELELKLMNYAQLSGKRIFLPVNLMNRFEYVPPKKDSRSSEVRIRMSYIDVDSITYIIPEGIHPEYTPKPVQFSSQFGDYSAEVSIESGKIHYIRKMRMNKGVYPKESYKEFREFYRKITKSDKAKVVFLRST